MMLGGFAATSPAQTSEQALPVVIDGKMPIYPVMARCARIQGVVTVKVTTDGKKVTALGEGSGPPMLVKFVKENISTWEFLQHKPISFVTTFTYVIEGPYHCEYTNSSTVLHLPLEVRISAEGLKTCDPAAEIKPHR
jgi:hypothetical protein